MAGIGGVNNSYSSYVPTYGKTANNDKNKTDGAANTNSANEAKDAENTSNVKSKNSTEDYLKQLREKFSKYNITVGNFDNLYASQKGTNNLVLDPKLVEKMASDPKLAAEIERKINWTMTEGLNIVRNASRGELTSRVVGFDEDGLVQGATASRRSSDNGTQGFNSLGSNGANQTGNMFDKMRTSSAENEKRMTEKREAKRAEEKKEKEALEKERMEEAQEKRAEANRKRLEELYSGSGSGHNDNLVWEFHNLDSLNAKS